MDVSVDDLVVNQYKGKEVLKLIYDVIVVYVKIFGVDFEILFKKMSVSFCCKKQFVLIQLLMKMWIDFGINLKGEFVVGWLEMMSGMCMYKVRFIGFEDFDDDVKVWLKEVFVCVGQCDCFIVILNCWMILGVSCFGVEIVCWFLYCGGFCVLGVEFLSW